MKKKITEIAALIALLLVLAGTPFAINYYSPWNNHGKVRVINLTAVNSQGIWTEDKVDGTNYWFTKFKKARIVLTKGEKVIFRFTSVDVSHSFYVPNLRLGPVFVDAGHLYDVPYTADSAGNFTYYCTTVCGKCHFYMQGQLIVLLDKNQPDTAFTEQLTISPCCVSPNNPANMNEIKNNSFLMNGKNVFDTKGCVTCHGKNGVGGVSNPFYVKNTIPELNTLATKLKIKEKNDADVIIKLLEKNANLDSLEDDPPIANYSRFLAQYKSISDKIKMGAMKLQTIKPNDPQPPLVMPSWEFYISDRDRNALIAYLISINKWEE